MKENTVFLSRFIEPLKSLKEWWDRRGDRRGRVESWRSG